MTPANPGGYQSKPFFVEICNSLFIRITDSLLRRLQSVQNAAARLVTGTRRCDHIDSSVLRQLHWLVVRQRITSPLEVGSPGLQGAAVLHDSTAAYLVDDCQLVSHSGRRRLRSADIETCCVPRTNTRFGDRSFAAAGPRLWPGFASPTMALKNFVIFVSVTLWCIVTFCFHMLLKYYSFLSSLVLRCAHNITNVWCCECV